jgi:integrase
MLGKAAEWGIIQGGPRIKLAKEYGRSTLIDSDAEAKLLAAIGQPLQDALTIMLDTGMRPAEVFRMRWEHVDFRQHMIFNPFGKTNNFRRYVPMSEHMLEALWVRAAGKTEGWVFPANSKLGHLMTVAKAFSEARRKAGLAKSVVLYCARHTFGT